MVVLTSASGSPGVTTAALGLGLVWARPAVLVDADPTGGSAVAAGYLRAGFALPEGLIDLALAAEDANLTEALGEACVAMPGTSLQFLAGGRSHGQARALLRLWTPLAAVLKGLDRVGTDVIVDAGRLGLFGHPEPLVDAADLTLLVTRMDLVSLAGARSWAETLRERSERSGAPASLAVLLVGPGVPLRGQGAPFTAGQVSGVLGLPVIGALTWDPDHAAVLSHGAEPPASGVLDRLAGRSGWEDSPLLRSMRAARSAITGAIGADRQYAPARRQA